MWNVCDTASRKPIHPLYTHTNLVLNYPFFMNPVELKIRKFANVTQTLFEWNNGGNTKDQVVSIFLVAIYSIQKQLQGMFKKTMFFSFFQTLRRTLCVDRRTV